MRQNQFSRRIARINVDEVHCIHTAGLPQYGLPPFRPAWGKLKLLKLLLSSKVPWIGFSATIPPHIHKTVVSHILRPNYVSIRYSSNRENTMYATHPVIGSIEDLRNYECFLASPFSLEKQPHILIFVDDKNLTNGITSHLESHLPARYQNRGLVRHYHGAMSEEYLKQVHNSFVREDGSCRILVATSGESVVSFLLVLIFLPDFIFSVTKGIDFPNVKIVCTAGLPSTIVDALQRGGRAIRIVSVDPALFVVFYDPWAQINE
jgi:superfamily II DNA helicase RecQ